MTFEEFRNSLQADSPPDGLGPELEALWHDARPDWHKAHELCQSAGSKEGDWVHAYLHRKEGDAGNADHWYARAGKPRPESDPDAEWESITRSLLG